MQRSFFYEFNLIITIAYVNNTLSQYPGWIHPRKFPGEYLFHKIITRGNTFGFFTSPTILHNLFHPVKNSASLIVPSEFSDFTWWVLILPLWFFRHSLVCGNISLESRQCEVTRPPEFEVHFLDNDRLIIFCLFSVVFYGKLGTGCYLLKVFLIKTVLMKNFVVIIWKKQQYHCWHLSG